MISVLFIWHAAVLAANQNYLHHMAADRQLDITLLVPPRWDESTAMVEAHLPPADSRYRVRIDEVHKGCKGLSYRFRNIRETLRQVRPDVIFLYEEPYSYVAWQMLYWKRQLCPQARLIFYTWQNLDCRYSFLRRQIESYVFRHSDLAVAGSQDVEEVLRLHGFTKEIRRIPLAIDPVDFPSPASPTERDELRQELNLQEFTFGYIGRLAREKGLEDLFEALGMLRQKPWQLLMIGGGPDETLLRQTAAKAGIGDRIVWVPYVKNTEMYRYYAVMDAFVLPSRTTRDWKEQFGRVLIEAMICQVPVVGSSSGEIPLVVGDSGLVFQEQAPAELAAALEKMLTDGPLRQRLAESGRQRVLERFTWERVGQETARLIREVATR